MNLGREEDGKGWTCIDTSNRAMHLRYEHGTWAFGWNGMEM